MLSIQISSTLLSLPFNFDIPILFLSTTQVLNVVFLRYVHYTKVLHMNEELFPWYVLSWRVSKQRSITKRNHSQVLFSSSFPSVLVRQIPSLIFWILTSALRNNDILIFHACCWGVVYGACSISLTVVVNMLNEICSPVPTKLSLYVLNTLAVKRTYNMRPFLCEPVSGNFLAV